MTTGAMTAAQSVVDDLLKTALPVVGDIVKAVAPLMQPFADALAKKIGEEEKEDSPSKSIEFSKDPETEKLMVSFKQ